MHSSFNNFTNTNIFGIDHCKQSWAKTVVDMHQMFIRWNWLSDSLLESSQIKQGFALCARLYTPIRELCESRFLTS